MSELLPIRNRTVTDPRSATLTFVCAPSAGAGGDSAYIERDLHRLASNKSPTLSVTSTQSQGRNSTSPSTLAERLYYSLADIKIMTSQVAMHLDDTWREKLFRRLDGLLSVDSWDEKDKVLQRDSFSTFIRLILLQKPPRQPSLRISQRGYLLADWTTGRDSLVIEFLPKDELRWVLVRYSDGERESAAGQTPLRRFTAVLSPYDPDRWFELPHGDQPRA